MARTNAVAGNQRASNVIPGFLLAGIAVVFAGCTSGDRVLTVAAVSCESRARNVEFNLERIEYWARQAADGPGSCSTWEGT